MITYLGQSSVFYESITLNTDAITYGSGTYQIYASSRLVSYSETKLLFNYLLTTQEPSVATGWGNGNYDVTTGAYNKDKYIKSDYLGDWLIIKLPYPIILTKFIYHIRNGLRERAPSLWKCYGSDDGINFNEIVEGSNDIVENGLISDDYNSNYYEKTLNTTFNIPYLYIAFTVNKLVGGPNSYLLNLSEIQLFGREFIEYIPVYISSNVIPNILLPYDKIIDRQDAIIGVSNHIINTSNILINTLTDYVTNTGLSNKFYMSSNGIADNYLLKTGNINLNQINDWITTQYGTYYDITNGTLAINATPTQEDILKVGGQTTIQGELIAEGKIKENDLYLNDVYVSSNVANNILLNYISNTALSNLYYMSSNAVENMYISSNNFYRGSNIVLEKPVKILNTGVDAFNRALIVGDGGRLTINGKYGTEGMFGAFSKIGVGDFAATNGGSTNTSITLYENGSIQYYGFSSNFSHLYVGKTYMPSLSIANLTMSPNILLNIGSITADNTGNMFMNSLTAGHIYSSNIGLKTPIKFSTSRTINAGGTVYYLYDIDLRKYTRHILLGARNFRQFQIRTWEADGNFQILGDIGQTAYQIFMSDYNGLSIRSYSDYLINPDLSRLDIIFSHTLLRNSFNYLSYASGTSPQTVYMIIEDLL